MIASVVVGMPTCVRACGCVCRTEHPPAEVVEHHDVGVHVVQVVAVGRVLLTGPDVRARALVREHVFAVLGLIIHAVKSCHLGRRRDPASSQGNELPEALESRVSGSHFSWGPIDQPEGWGVGTMLLSVQRSALHSLAPGFTGTLRAWPGVMSAPLLRGCMQAMQGLELDLP